VTALNKQALINTFKIASLNYQSSMVPLPTGPVPRSQVTVLQENIIDTLCNDLIMQVEKQKKFEKNRKNLSDLALKDLELGKPKMPRYMQNNV